MKKKTYTILSIIDVILFLLSTVLFVVMTFVDKGLGIISIISLVFMILTIVGRVLLQCIYRVKKEKFKKE